MTVIEPRAWSEADLERAAMRVVVLARIATLRELLAWRAGAGSKVAHRAAQLLIQAEALLAEIEEAG